MKEIDQYFMRQALRLARKCIGQTSPNPAVGAVIVRGREIIATGYHKRAGDNHAEIEALKDARGKIKDGDTLYVTLEPCNHFGRTPPCTEAILKSGIKNVVIGMKDPNPDVDGGGCEFLKQNGIEIRSGILESECRQLNEDFIKFVSTGRPFVIAKSALTMDGWTAASSGHSRWVTNEKSRRFVHKLRRRLDGILVGIGTVLKDDPRLTVRLDNRQGRDPVRIIADTHLKIPEKAGVLNNSSLSQTLIIVGDHVPAERYKKIQGKMLSIIPCPTKKGRIDLNALMDILGRRKIISLMVEGGATLMGSMIREKLIDKFYIFKAPKILGGDDGIPMISGPGPTRIDESMRLRDLKVRRFGDDILIRAYPDY